MPLRRCIAPVSSSAFTARSIETSPQISSLTLLPEPPKSSPTVPLNDAPDLLLQAILTKRAWHERMPQAGDGCNISVSERRENPHRRDEGPQGAGRDPEAAAEIRRGGS